MDRKAKKSIIQKSGAHGTDTGSAQVQIALLTERIHSLTEHLKTHPKDNHSRRGLFSLVGKRRTQLQYLKRSRPAVYQAVVEQNKIGKQGQSSTEEASAS